MSETIVLPTHPLFNNLTDRKFGRLTVIAYAGRVGKKKISAWRVRCDCGTEKVVSASHLNQGLESCGCLRLERVREVRGTHGLCGTPEYRAWSHLIGRCENENDGSYPHYGARGIRVCERWRNSFEAFLEDMGPRPLGTEIDRYPNNDGNYEPGNCRWATRVENARNKRSNHAITFRGETRCASEWEEIFGLPKGRVVDRIRKGWSVERALTTPLDLRRLGQK